MSAQKKEKARLILEKLLQAIPEPETELKYSTPWELLLAVILSAQCTDKRVNMVSPALFEKYPDANSLAKSDFDTLFPYIRSISYPNNKAKHLLGAAQQIVALHGGEVPKDYEALLALPGVGRKTANVLNSVLYNEPRMPVDTHVFRVSRRLGLAKGNSPEKVESELLKIIPPLLIPRAHHLLILHGRYTCTARNPKCEACVLHDLCRSKDKTR